MLSMVLLLAAAPQSAIPPMPPAPVPAEQGRMPVLGQPGPGCASLAMPANNPDAGNTLLWREGQDRVGHYLLLDRYVGGCPAPIIVNYRIPGSNAVGREGGRSPAPTSAVSPRR